jgi:hypothetical protein
MKGFKITYEIITPESAKQGDFEDQGWIDEEGIDLTPDEFDIEDGLTVVDKAVRYLKSETGAEGMEASCYPVEKMTKHGWFTSYSYSVDYQTGAIENRSFHPIGFTAGEIREIARRVWH